MTSFNRIIKGDQVTSEVVNWHAPSVDSAGIPPSGNDEAAPPDPAVVREQAWQQGFAQGRAEGIEDGRAELAQSADILKRVLENLARPLKALDHQFEEEMLALVTVIAKQLLRRELHNEPSQIIGIIREGLAALPSGSAEIRVQLHPQDAEIVRELLKPEEAGRSWSIEIDPLIEQGGCQINSETAQIDGRLETRLSRIVAGMLEDERAAR